MKNDSLHSSNHNSSSPLPGFPLLAILILILFHFSASGEATADEKKPYESISLIDSVLTQDSTLRGNVVYVDFWASWCVPCRQSFPWMNKLHEDYGDHGLRIVTVNLDTDHAAAEKFYSELGAGLSVIYDSTGTLGKLFEIEAMPMSFIYDRDGNLSHRHLGFRPDETAETESLIVDLLDEEESD